MPYILNHQRCAWILPASADDVHKAVIINPGQSRPVDAAHWDAVRKDNRVIDALLTGRYLTVHDTEPDTDVRLKTIDTAPVFSTIADEQQDLDEAEVKRDGKVTAAEIDLDEPKAAKSKRR